MANALNHQLTPEELFCLEGCRTQKQYDKMRGGFEIAACSFCQIDRTFNKVLWEDEHTMVWKVPEDYLRNTLKLHVLVVPKQHVRFAADLNDEQAVSMHHGQQFVRRELGYQGGLSHTREGDMRLNAGTVPHLHCNIFEPDPEVIQQLVEQTSAHLRKEGKKVEIRIPVYKDPGERAQNQGRAATFAEQYQLN